MSPKLDPLRARFCLLQIGREKSAFGHTYGVVVGEGIVCEMIFRSGFWIYAVASCDLVCMDSSSRASRSNCFI